MSDPRTDLEERLADVLAQGAGAAPSAIGLAGAARARARQRRRTRLAGGAAFVALAVAVPVGVAVLSGGDRPGHESGPAGGNKATDPVDGGDDAPTGYHYESWHGVSIEVPNTWSYGPLTTWCAGDGSPDEPRISRPGVVIDIACTPLSSYGVAFTPASGNDVEWPVAGQHSDSWPDGAYVGATTVNGVVVTVAARKSTVTEAILASARTIGPQGDPNGCTSSRGEARPDVAAGEMAICRYDDQGLLEQSELLTGDDATAAAAAIAEAPTTAYAPPCPPGEPAAGELAEYVVMHTTTHAYRVVWQGTKCADRGVFIDDRHRRELTPDVLYWALSPGWTGAVDADVPLPDRLRQ
jgi:hypothetical protein